MTERELEARLTRAAGSEPTPSLPGDFATRVRRRQRRRHKIRAAAFGTTCAALIVATSVPIAISLESPRAVVSALPTTTFELEMESINERLAELELRVRSLKHAGKAIDSEEVDVLAKRLLHLGAVLEEVDGQPLASESVMTSVATLFPESVWADVARNRTRIPSTP